MLERQLGDGVRVVFDGRSMTFVAKRSKLSGLNSGLLNIDLGAVDELLVFMRELERKHGSLPVAARAIEIL